MYRFLTIVFFSMGALSGAPSLGAEKSFSDPCAPDPQITELAEQRARKPALKF
jgi:hypothetical protein